MNASLPDLTPYVAPLAEPGPTGRDLRLEPEHERLRVEIAKLNDVRGESPDWPLVQATGSEILLSRSKDLLIAAYVACALTRQAGLAGAEHGAALLEGLLSAFGTALFPGRQRARANALDWYLEWMCGYLDNAQPEAATSTQGLRTRLRALNVVAADVLGDDAPLFDQVFRACERLERSAPAETQAAEPALAVAPIPEAQEGTEAAGEAASIEAWLAPLAGAPAGIDSTYDEQHVAVRVEIEKLQGLGSETPNWAAVLEGSDALLRGVTKDLTVATYLAAALFEVRGALGLAAGLDLCIELSNRFWDAMWPPVARIKRRANALDWLFDRTAQRLASTPAPTQEHAPRVVAAVERMSALLTERFGGPSASWPAFSDAVIAWVAKAAPAPAAPTPRASIAPPPPPPPVAAPPPVPKPVVAPDVAGAQFVFAAPPEAPNEIFAYTLRAGLVLVNLAVSRFASDRRDARAYRWLRAGVWMQWERAPSANRRGRTELDGPAPAQRAELDKLLRAEQWDELLAFCERMVARHALWLDPNFLSALALERLGPEYEAARAHVERESRSFASRLPEVSELQFSDGSPLATPETLAWLKPVRRGGGEATAELPAPLVERLQRAERPAVEELEALLKTVPSQRAAFQLRLEFAHALARGEQNKLAAHVYLGLEQDIDRYGLETWEPELALQVLQSLSELLSKGSPLGVAPSEGARICARLARLLPTALL